MFNLGSSYFHVALTTVRHLLNVIVNPQLSAEQRNQVKDLLIEYEEVFSDVPKVTHLIEHKVELTESEPVKRKPYPIPYKMQEVIDKEIEDMLAMGIIERSVTVIPPTLGSRKNTVRVRNKTQRVNSLCFIQRLIKSHSISLFLMRIQSPTDTDRLSPLLSMTQ